MSGEEKARSECMANIKKRNQNDKVIALAGNPNVGKSTVFNALTGMRQHTGNWSGKTVSSAKGYCKRGERGYLLVDIPGTYSFSARSAEEEVARDFLCFEAPDAVIVVCDATCLERNMNLVLQTLEITDSTVVCVNLMDEARKKGIKVNIKALEEKLGVSVVATEARRKKGLKRLLEALDKERENRETLKVLYPDEAEGFISRVEERVKALAGFLPARFCAIKLLCGDKSFEESLCENCAIKLCEDEAIKEILNEAKEKFSGESFDDIITKRLIDTSEEIYRGAVCGGASGYTKKEKTLDKLFVGKKSAFPVMLFFLAAIFWLTIEGANYLSSYLSDFLLGKEMPIYRALSAIKLPPDVCRVLSFGVWRVLAWVVSVMLPPMAIFFPLFTLLEDFGYLPRIAFNLDRVFKKCNACGKQSLTMCMGFGCNAVGVVGCRIIDSPRERLVAMLTNSFVPCNGRFPTLIALITIFFAGSLGAFHASLLSTSILTLVIVVGVLATFLASKLLSQTFLRGVPSSFMLELPPYRRPQIGKVIIRSVFDRTLFVLGRAIKAAAPAGLIIWLMANVTVGGKTLLGICSGFLDPFARIFGLDGVILTAFVLCLPANEILMPIIIMAYTAQGTLSDASNLVTVAELLRVNGWDWITAVCVMLFSLMHWPCSTTLMTIKKESQSVKWTIVAFLLPTVFGMVACFAFNLIARLIA